MRLISAVSGVQVPSPLIRPEHQHSASMKMRARLDREKTTIAVMVGMYCRALHSPAMEICPDCRALLRYAGARVDACRFGRAKPVCARCTVHCYGRTMRGRMREVMRFSGPRMILRHPLMAARHLMDSLRGPGAAGGEP